jgi:hypothetical protein
METGPRFFCDEQLGKLARWLRIIGQDTLYERQIADADLIARARAEGRIVLTRDRRLPERAAGVEIIVLAENYPALQLREVARLFAGRMSIRVFSRCVACNGEIEPVAKAGLEGQVPPFVFATQNEFTRCRDCGRVYWQATHRARVDHILGDLIGPEKVDSRS